VVRESRGKSEYKASAARRDHEVNLKFTCCTNTKVQILTLLRLPGPTGYQGWRGEKGPVGGAGPMGRPGGRGEQGMPVDICVLQKCGA
jgi:hypothetical protein